ncbi:MAG: FtsW/RodA/SpoVE family cell cycle protein [Flavobacteriaceae bacterium]
MNKNVFFRLDWFSLFLYLLLMTCGLINIYSSTYNEITISIWDISSPFVKQLWIFLICFLTLPFWMSIKPSFFEHTSYLFYALSLLSLIGLFFFGQTISGATSWYFIGGFGLQPAEFAKITTS